MSAVSGLLLMLVLLPIALMAAALGAYLVGLSALIACPVFLYLANSAADAHNWVLMWHRLGWSSVCAVAAVGILWPSMNMIAAHPTSPCCGDSKRERAPEFSDYLGAMAARESVSWYMRRKAEGRRNYKNGWELFW